MKQCRCMIGPRGHLLRKRASYAMFRRLADDIDRGATTSEILEMIFNLLNAKSAFKSETNARYAYESLNQVKSDIENR